MRITGLPQNLNLNLNLKLRLQLQLNRHVLTLVLGLILVKLQLRPLQLTATLEILLWRIERASNLTMPCIRKISRCTTRNSSPSVVYKTGSRKHSAKSTKGSSVNLPIQSDNGMRTSRLWLAKLITRALKDFKCKGTCRQAIEVRIVHEEFVEEREKQGVRAQMKTLQQAGVTLACRLGNEGSHE